MRVIHVLRKPLSEKTVAANVLKHGTGAINVDASRVLSGPSEGGKSSGGNAFGQDAGWNKTDVYVQGIDRSMSKGRWPGNLILQHLDGCRCEGAKQLRSSAEGKSGGHSWGLVNDDGWEPRGVPDTRPWLGPDGLETVPDWRCSSGCPVADLDEQSGELHSRGNRKPSTSGEGSGNTPPRQADHGPGEEGGGGASRFFKQVGGQKP